MAILKAETNLQPWVPQELQALPADWGGAAAALQTSAVARRTHHPHILQVTNPKILPTLPIRLGRITRRRFLITFTTMLLQATDHMATARIAGLAASPSSVMCKQDETLASSGRLHSLRTKVASPRIFKPRVALAVPLRHSAHWRFRSHCYAF